MTSTWDIISSSFMLLAFLGAVYGVSRLLNMINAQTQSTQSSLQSKGMSYQDGKLSVKTDRPAPSHEEYIASTQRAFENTGRVLSERKAAFKVGKPEEEKQSTPEKKGFQRGKKLA